MNIWDRQAGMLPLSEYVLKFNLPPLPEGKSVRYRVIARAAGWIKVRQFYHGEFKLSEPHIGPPHTFRTLDPNADSTTFAVWNDTHENAETLRALDRLTTRLQPDFMLCISGHTHDYLWMPAQEGQPIAQLIGGAPSPKFATFIQCTATHQSLNIKMSKLDGTVVTDVSLNA